MAVNRNELNSDTLNVLSTMMPVGYIFQWVPTDGGPDLSTAEKVAAYYGFGTWEEISGRFLFGRSSSYGVGSVGGNETHTHTNPVTGSTAITVDQMPSHSHSIAHTHTFSGTTSTTGAHSHPTQGWKGASGDGQAINRWRQSGDPVDYSSPILSAGDHSHTYSGTTSASSVANSGANGSGNGHTHTMGNTGATNHMPPYLAVYMWKRVS